VIVLIGLIVLVGVIFYVSKQTHDPHSGSSAHRQAEAREAYSRDVDAD
jgi:hypothetical protein